MEDCVLDFLSYLSVPPSLCVWVFLDINATGWPVIELTTSSH
jgi:hypothetical protein